MKAILITFAVVCASMANANDNSSVVKEIKVSHWGEVDLSRPRMGDIGGVEDAIYQQVAIDDNGVGYWAACTPPTGYTSFVLPTSAVPLRAQEVVRTASGMYAFKPGSMPRTVGYHLYNFTKCAYMRATSLGVAQGPKTIIIRKNTPIFGTFGLKEFEIK